MSSRDAQEWAAATDVASLAALTARWLTGALNDQPGYAAGHGPAAETAGLIGPLVAANHAGFLTADSQPGHAPVVEATGDVWAQCAAVDGFLPWPRVSSLRDQARAAGLIVIVQPVGGWWLRAGGIITTTRNGEPATGFGRRYRRRDIRLRYGAVCDRRAVRDIQASAHVTIIDPRFADTRTLWDVLASWAS